MAWINSSWLIELPLNVRDCIRTHLDVDDRVTLRRVCRQLAVDEPAFPRGWEWYRVPYGGLVRLYHHLMILQMNRWPQLGDSELYVIGNSMCIEWRFAQTGIYLGFGEGSRLRQMQSNALLGLSATRKEIWERTRDNRPPVHLRANTDDEISLVYMGDLKFI